MPSPERRGQCMRWRLRRNPAADSRRVFKCCTPMYVEALSLFGSVTH
jgi:hypothetical protein